MMTKKLKITVGLIVLVGMVFYWFALRSTYKKTVFRLAQCNGLPVTMVEYWTIYDRGVAFVYGEYEGNFIPEKESLIQPDLTGFDAMFDAIITCHNDTIVVYHYDGLFKQNPMATKIKEKRLHSEDYDSLRRNYIGQPIRVF